MRISRIFCAQPLQSGVELVLDGQSAHYLAKVLRLDTGASLVLFNGDGSEYSATLTDVGKKSVTVLPGAQSWPAVESPLKTVLGLGISRGERMDYAIQKATELGVSVIAPLFTEHCEVRLSDERKEKRLEHWQQVAISACEQSGRVRVPEVLAPQPLAAWVKSAPAELRLVFDHRQAATLDGARPEGGVALLIGPEGGLAPAEIDLARSAGFNGIALGKRVLRTETAPVAALAVLQYLWG
ncbi:MAG: 16S rRNA (uracil(1498)-N(3))-methyltransferase [Pseudomonadota bacterium]|nr:16S rRNA (uracil(1498)-N(3))-methyltransferase [Pseudomonadota bacterium]